MPTKFFDWFIDHQLKLMAAIGAVCIGIVAAIRGPFQLIFFETLVCLLLALVGSLLYLGETSESWLELSWSQMFKNKAGLILIGLAWLLFVGGRGAGVISETIALVILKLG